MAMLRIHSVCFDIGHDYGSVSNVLDHIINYIQTAWSEGADVVLFPEYMWGALCQYQTPQLTLSELADLFWHDCWPRLQASLSQADKTVILGSVTRRGEDGTLFNTVPILFDGKIVFQDKLSLTPWESMMVGGRAIHVFDLPSGHRAAVLICLDCEMPDLVAKVKLGPRVDVIFIPSATESLMGVERIARCASSRAVELGVAVITSAICGEVKGNDFLGANIGRMALYLPSLKGLEQSMRVQESIPQKKGHSGMTFEIDDNVFVIARNEKTTTNPANIRVQNDIQLLQQENPSEGCGGAV
jgi:predicted amidohydrolase